MAIILPHTTADIPFFRSNGVSYQRTQQSVALIPDHTWDEMVIPSDFIIGGSCAACQDALNTPHVCPCSGATWHAMTHNWWETPIYAPCGDPLDPVYRFYTVHLSDLAFCSGCAPEITALDTPVWDGSLQPNNDSNSCYWTCDDQGTTDSGPIRISGTNISRVATSMGGARTATGGLSFNSSNRLWIFAISSGGAATACTGLWVKNTGNSPDGVYTVLGCGETLPNQPTNRAITPTSILIEHAG